MFDIDTHNTEKSSNASRTRRLTNVICCKTKGIFNRRRRMKKAKRSLRALLLVIFFSMILLLWMVPVRAKADDE